MKLADLPNETIELGPGRSLTFFTIDGEHVIGAFEHHPAASDTAFLAKGQPCEGAIYFEVPELPRMHPDDRQRWTVESWDPLTLAPSILCKGCGNHGHVRNGGWIPA